MSTLVKLYNYVLYGMAYCSGETIFIAVVLIVIDVPSVGADDLRKEVWSDWSVAKGPTAPKVPTK